MSGNGNNINVDNGTVMSSPSSPYSPLNEAEARVFCSIVKNIEGKPEINWDRVAEECNLKSAEVAKVRLSRQPTCDELH